MREKVVDSWIWNQLRGTALGKALKQIDWYYKLNIETTTTTVGELQAEFITESRSEYLRVKNFVGEQVYSKKFLIDWREMNCIGM